MIYPATAVMMVIALGVLGWLAKTSRREVGPKDIIRPASVPAERLELLARFEPPAYKPGNETSRFRDAMRHYTNADYAGAATELSEIVLAHPDDVEARFYLGISLVLSKQTESGVRQLREVISAGQTPYLEPARFYLAKTLLGRGDLSGAQQELQDVQAMHGELEKQATSLIQQMKP